jgi:outer membrane protein assembly factor BamB
MPGYCSIRSLLNQTLYLFIFAALFSLSAPLDVLALETVQRKPAESSNFESLGNYRAEGLSTTLKSKWDRKVGGFNRFKGTPQSNPSSPLIIGSTLYVGSSIGIFYAYSLDKGKELWQFDAGSAIHASAASESSICFGTTGGKLFCLDRLSGTERFSYEITSSINSAPVMDSERVYMISTNDRLHALNVSDGKKLWTYSQRSMENLASRFINTPAQSTDKIFVILSNGSLVAISKDTGKELWQRRVLKGDGPWPGARKTPRYVDGNLYIIDKDGVLLVLDANTGSLHVVFDVTKAVDFIVTRDNIIIASNEELISVSRMTGDVVWIEALDPAATNRIFAAGEHIYIVSVKEKDPVWLAYVMRKRSVLSAYTIDDGTFVWKRKFSSSVTADIEVASDHLAILTDKGRLYVLDAKDE